MRTGVAWPGMPSQRGSVLLSLQFQFERTQWWPAERLLEHQLLQLTRLAQHAYDTVPFYRERFDAAGLRPGSGLSLADLRALPVLTRREIQDAGRALWSGRVPPEHGQPEESQTGGSTGEPVKVRGTDVTAVFWDALALRDHFWHRRDFSGKLAVIRATARGVGDPPQGSMLPDWGAPANEVFATGPGAVLNLTAAEIDVQARWLMQQEPDYLLTYPSNLAALITRLSAVGDRPRRLRAVRTFGEVVTPELRAACRDGWGVPLQDAYSANEFGYMALQCPASDQYHVMSESVHLEILSAEGRPCAPGETGRLVATGLHNYAMPLIRYEIGDYAEIGAACPCGRGLPLIARIAGRERNMLTLPGGRQRWPRLSLSRWSHIAPVRQLQLVQEAVERVVARIVTDRELTAEEETGLIAALRQGLDYPGEIELERVEEIRRGAGGKFEQFLSRVRNPQ